MTRKSLTKTALVISLALIILWVLLGTTSTITWFHDEDKLVNSLYFGDLDVEVYYKTASGYQSIDNATDIFGSGALYEPGYTQVVYFKTVNEGTVDFTYELSVVASDWVDGLTEDNQPIHLPEHLTFGVVYGDTEAEVEAQVKDRTAAAALAVTPLANYASDRGTLAVGESEYFALIVYMPVTVSNEANYRGDAVPSVTLGISVKANQIQN